MSVIKVSSVLHYINTLNLHFQTCGYLLYLLEIHCWGIFWVPFSSGIYRETKSCKKDNLHEFHVAEYQITTER